MSLLLNLQQRHVFRAVAWYAGVAWLAIEVSNTVFPQFGLPDWSVRAVIVVAMLGLPIVVALAWWLDLSRLGLRREQALPEGLASAQVTPGQPALVARALHELWVVPEPRGNLEAALADLQRALEISPNDAEAHDVAAVTLRRLGRFDEALAYFEQLSLLRPGPEARMAIVQTLLNTGRFEALENELRSIAVRYPSEKWPALLQEFVEFLRSGDTDGWHDLHERIAPGLIDLYRSYLTWRLLICTGDYAGLAELYSGRDPLTLPGASPDLDLGIVHVLLGDSARARPLLLAAASAGRKPADLRQAVNASMVRAAGAMALALLGENTDAVREADAAVELLPESRDAVNGPQVAMARAWVLIATGERAEEGYAELQRLLGAWELWPRWVAARPEWRLLAGDSRVQIIFEAAYAAP